MHTPCVTVLMPVYNGEKYLREAIESILNQTYTDFEFLIINDGSEDSTVEIIRSYKDTRISLIHNEGNRGLVFSLNKGLELAQGKYIVRMDCDDISVPVRLEKQVSFMEKNPEIGISGSWFQRLGTGEIVGHPVTHEAIKVALFQYSSLGHPTVIIRKDLLRKFNLYYNEQYLHAEDYELWTRCVYLFPLANLPEVLLLYREHSSQVTTVNENRKKKTVGSIHLHLLNNIGIHPSEDEFKIHKKIMTACDFSFLPLATKWLEKIQYYNQQHKIYEETIFSEFLASLWTPFVLTSPDFDRKTLQLFYNSTLRPYSKISLWDRVKFYIKCLLGISK